MNPKERCPDAIFSKVDHVVKGLGFCEDYAKKQKYNELKQGFGPGSTTLVHSEANADRTQKHKTVALSWRVDGPTCKFLSANS